MARQLVVCIDGTSNRFSNTPTNIVRLYRSLPKGSDEVLTYYDQGVGTFGLSETLFEWQKIPTRVAGLAFGWGMQRIVLDAYRFLMQNYQPGDRIFLFGFSRGAYAVRILAAMVHCLGLLPADQPQLLDAAWALLTTRTAAADRSRPPAGKLRYIGWRFTAPKAPDFELMAQFKAAFGREANIHYLGLFDTVTSTGWIYDPLIVPYTSRNPSVAVVRHALSIDERRCFFRANLWRPKPGRPGADVDLKQVWFAGVHSDIGGGYAPDQSQLALLSLRWMLGEALEVGLTIDVELCRAQLYPADGTRGDPLAPQHDSMTAGWLIAEWIPQLHWDKNTHRRVLRLGSMPPFGQPRWRQLPEPPEHTDLHVSVRQRLAGPVEGGLGPYLPPNLAAVPEADRTYIEDAALLARHGL